MKPIISFRNFSFTYRSLSEPTLKQINLDILPGEKILIAGPSGSGKSTLAHCINGLIPFSYEGEISGELLFHGQQNNRTSIFEVSQLVGTILQDQDAQFVGLSVGEDVAFVLENEMTAQEIMHQEVCQAVATVDMLDFLDYSPYELSGGQKQRVSLAGILATPAEVLLFDEPLANLDPASGQRAMQLIDEIQRKTKKTVIIIEHRIEDVLEQKIDRIVVMKQGQIEAIGTPDQLLASPILRETGLREPLYIEALKYAQCDLGENDQLATFEQIKQPRFSAAIQEWFKRQEEQKSAQANPSATTPSPSEPLLSVRDLRFAYDSRTEVIKGISFDIYEGETIALLGNNGAGKSTLSNLITGICKPTSGVILYQGENIQDWSIKQRGQKIGYVMQNPNQMITQQMIWDEVGLGLAAQGLPQDVINERVEQALHTCGLYPYRNWPVSALSYGQKKRVTIASILVLQPKLIILDEPTAGQDYQNYTEFMQFIKGLSAQGFAFLFITHDMHLALEYTDRAIVLSTGQVMANDKVYNVLTNQEVLHKANLKETSLTKLAVLTGIDRVEDFVQYFIHCEKKVKPHG